MSSLSRLVVVRPAEDLLRRLWLVSCLLSGFLRAADPPRGDGTALPSAATSAVAFKQLRLGKAVVSLPAQWTTLGPEIPMWLHLHGAPGTLEPNFARMGAPGVLVNLTLPGLSQVYADHCVLRGWQVRGGAGCSSRTPSRCRRGMRVPRRRRTI